MYRYDCYASEKVQVIKSHNMPTHFVFEMQQDHLLQSGNESVSYFYFHSRRILGSRKRRRR